MSAPTGWLRAFTIWDWDAVSGSRLAGDFETQSLGLGFCYVFDQPKYGSGGGDGSFRKLGLP